MSRTEIMKEYQQKLEGMFKKNYSVATPLLQTYDQQHEPFDSIDLRLQTINHMDRQGTTIPKETLEYISNQLNSISANYTVEEQKSFLRNEGRKMKLNQESISIKIPTKKKEKIKTVEQERIY
ncbi:hypothetical protein IA823_12710 [Listeria welshimeri]|uniref:hypothetical protein n=1 Tax=Listeria welshimeri TaxID=1643 RepID=UPI0018893CCF|nr:hypothetical protein [Listeria welshimeri]MBF2413497.1 hypothetical protein [Listeria welshimeri]